MAAKTGNNRGFLLLVGTIVFALAIYGVAQLPSRMPPDPFQDHDSLRIVRFVVDWGPIDPDDPSELPRDQEILWAAGDDAGETLALPDGKTKTGRWEHSTTARPGDIAELTSIQIDYGPLICAIFIEEELPDDGWIETDDVNGCSLEVLVP